MPTFNAFTFSVLVGQNAQYPWFERPPLYSDTPIPLGNKSKIQWGGLGSPKLTVQVRIDSDADKTGLENSRDGSEHALAGYYSYDTVQCLLVEMNRAVRFNFTATWFAELVFLQEAS